MSNYDERFLVCNKRKCAKMLISFQMDYPTFEAKAAENSIKLINCMIKNY